jgi:Ca2+-binding RTX toxin-like protein
MSDGKSASGSEHMQQLESRAYFSGFPPVLAPTDVAATALTSTSVKISWVDNAVNETNYFIFRSTDNVHYAKVITAPVFAQSWTDLTAAPATTYFYKVQAHALTANSAQSTAANVTTPATQPFATLNAATGQLIVTGTSDADNITLSISGASLIAKLNGTPLTFVQADVKRISIYALSGDDKVVINAGVGSVYISGGDGADTLIGNAGNDRIDAGAGDDSVKSEEGNDTIVGGTGDDTIYGQDGNDVIQGNDGNDKIIGGAGDDLLSGNAGNDRLYGQTGVDTLIGGSGDNFIVDN